ncbi:MAG: hypothetical protein GXP26_08615 [Planctomycetes bacterium]|nr:hypothetical protein [Planctomycetota bacterium]
MRETKQFDSKDKNNQAKTEFDKMIELVCSRGFFGSASVTVNIQDGRIQYTRVAVDRMIR